MKVSHNYFPRYKEMQKPLFINKYMVYDMKRKGSSWKTSTHKPLHHINQL